MLVSGLAGCTICDCAHSGASCAITNMVSLSCSSFRRVTSSRISLAFGMRWSSSESPQPFLWAPGPFQWRTWHALEHYIVRVPAARQREHTCEAGFLPRRHHDAIQAIRAMPAYGDTNCSDRQECLPATQSRVGCGAVVNTRVKGA